MLLTCSKPDDSPLSIKVPWATRHTDGFVLIQHHVGLLKVSNDLN